MKKRLVLLMFACVFCLLTACASGQGIQVGTKPSAASQQTGAPSAGQAAFETDAPETVEEEAKMKLQVQIGDAVFTATLEDNAAADAFAAMMEEAPVTIQMRDYGGFEKVGSLGANLPTSNNQTTTTAGDIVLYNGNQIVIFYGSNSWSYTRLGKIDDLTDWAEALGSGDVRVTFSIGG